MQSSFAAAETERLEKLRDDDVTALQLRAGLVGGCLLLAVAVSVAVARSLTRPLSVLKRGSQRLLKDPVGEEPITFRGVATTSSRTWCARSTHCVPPRPTCGAGRPARSRNRTSSRSRRRN
ncbi:hypothetical protein IHE61_30915 [Streptomyces sp. GKU 257-1]|nr:hypothetical protein [Streptomyces sp. GKU 257-1]